MKLSVIKINKNKIKDEMKVAVSFQFQYSLYNHSLISTKMTERVKKFEQILDKFLSFLSKSLHINGTLPSSNTLVGHWFYKIISTSI